MSRENDVISNLGFASGPARCLLTLAVATASFLFLPHFSLADSATTTGTFFGDTFGYLYSSNDPIEGGEVFTGDEIEVFGLQKFNPAAGSLTEINITTTAEIFVDVFMDTNFIIDPTAPHSASFAPSFFSVQVNVEYRPSNLPNTGRFLAFESFNISAECQGFSGNEDNCMGFNNGFADSLPSSGVTINRLELEDFIGEGALDTIGISTFVPIPDGSHFTLDNVASAEAEVTVDISDGEVEIEYIFNTGGSPADPLLPLPPGLEPPEFADSGIDCMTQFCLGGTIGEAGPGVDSPLWLDPLVAVGYDYEVVAGPNIAGVQLPDGFGDDMYDVLVFDENLGQFVPVGSIGAFETLDLLPATGGLGASLVRVLGIEPEAGVDPEDPEGFPTGLLFVDGGAAFAVAMMPIAIPEPASAVLAMLAAILFAVSRCSRD